MVSGLCAVVLLYCRLSQIAVVAEFSRRGFHERAIRREHLTGSHDRLLGSLCNPAMYHSRGYRWFPYDDTSCHWSALIGSACERAMWHEEVNVCVPCMISSAELPAALCVCFSGHVHQRCALAWLQRSRCGTDAILALAGSVMLGLRGCIPA
jgi:hypothetical protein